MSLRIFSDYHHSGLFYSLKLLFEDRLGGKIFRPIGEEWFNLGYWEIARPYENNPATVKQYLSLDQTFSPVDGSNPLNQLKTKKSTHFEVQELAHNYTQKAISWEQFLDMDFDIILASIPDHAYAYTKLRDIYKPKAKVIFQMGNMFSEIEDLMIEGVVKNLLSSTIPFPVPSWVNAVFYHQEQPVREFRNPPADGKIKSFVHLLPQKDLFSRYKEALPNIEFKAFGALCPNGSLSTLYEVYDEMMDSSFIWNVKPLGDGFGWAWHSAFMLGRPVITNFSDYQDKLGGLLFSDGETGIDLEKRPLMENVKLISSILEDKDRHLEMCKSAYKKFQEVVNYREEEKRIREFLDKLL